jgi:hypothetical protein
VQLRPLRALIASHVTGPAVWGAVAVP